MATEERKPSDPVKAEASGLFEALTAEAPRTDFFALVGLLERLLPAAARVGGDGPPQHERLRFRHDPSLGFPSGDVSGAKIVHVPGKAFGEPARDVVEITTTFLGLTGAVSPLPLYIPAEVAHDNAGQNLQASFLDIFHHRLISLFYRLFTRYEYARELTADCDDAWSRRVLTLAAPSYVDRTRPSLIARHKLLALAPILVRRGRTARDLVLALEVALDIAPGQVHVVQLAGGFVPIDDAQRMRLAHDTAVLGRTAVIGSQAYERASRFRIQLGPMSVGEYPRYVDNGDRIALVREVVTLLVREPLDYDVELLLGNEALSGFALSAGSSAARPSRLGRATRLRSSGRRQSVIVRNVGRVSAA